MIVIPAVDLRDGACVQLVGGDYADEAVRLEDPLEVARGWARLGFPWLHVVDLDAATERGSNAALVRAIAHDTGALVQAGGGVRSEERIEALLDDGVARVVVGTRALEDPDWLRDMAGRFPGVLVVAADVRERRVVTRGWTRTLARDVMDVMEELDALPLAGVLVTAVHREGKMQGVDLFLIDDLMESSRLPLIASGGIGGMRDLEALDERGVSAAVVGMALYTGALEPRVVAEEYSA
ncbi:MAG TPA: 1-(5-phosphoribosyl)-5-[(5-phosphoribosylamino)methylideneamino] imidazole-4-carboxamide isomerase [Gemmatimonadaceae bacterium]|nr:1-(5-phosphoribosyl)-5-[(5-phosphoribosylamino)methylideneamino] imidazole-4-carboxamide isomerase [Gemmatimonadaceae bacterium]